MNVHTLRRAACDYCGAPLPPFPHRSCIEPCRHCRRPMVLTRLPGSPRALPRIRGLLDLAGTAAGIAMVVLVAAFIVSDMMPRTFSKWLVILLFVMGSGLAVDGVLAMRTGFDRTWKKIRRDRAARLMGGAKITAGIYAFLLVLVGIAL